MIKIPSIYTFALYIALVPPVLSDLRSVNVESNLMWQKRGKVIDEADRVVTDPLRARERTMNRALKLLAVKPRSISEMRERLLEKRWTNESVVDDVIESLKVYKYLDDEQFARDFAMSKLRQKPIGRRRLQQTLSQRKLEKEIVEQAMGNVFEQLPEDELIDRAIEKRLRLKGMPKTREDTKRFYDHLLRQGFGYDLIREKMSDLGKDPVDQDEDE